MSTVLDSLNHALKTALDQDERVIILGEDILDPYGGAFKVTRGLSSAFPERTLTTPVSEAGIVGIATGMALRGLRPVIEIMFGDFVTLIADQVINHATKFRYMYNEQVNVPIVIRTPMGGRRGYGPTHSQTLEKLFLGTPGLHIFAPNIFMNPGELLLNVILNVDDPVLFIENKILYSQHLLGHKEIQDFRIIDESRSYQGNNEISIRNYAPSLQLTLRDAPPASVTVATYGYMANLCREAALRLAYEDEIFIDIVVFSQLSPLKVSSILSSIKNSHRLLVVEEGTKTSGWGAEVLAASLEENGDLIHQARRVASPDMPIPASSALERDLLPGVEDIIQAVKMMV
jgi:pyruvate/2-oxoglutarate/acetoin dehydrogenase E1 component